jgi:hypothetical protein
VRHLLDRGDEILLELAQARERLFGLVLGDAASSRHHLAQRLVPGAHRGGQRLVHAAEAFGERLAHSQAAAFGAARHALGDRAHHVAHRLAVEAARFQRLEGELVHAAADVLGLPHRLARRAAQVFAHVSSWEARPRSSASSGPGK